MFKIIDLSMPVEPGAGEPESPRVRFLSHRNGACRFCNAVHNQLEPADFPAGEFLSNEYVRLSVHTGTHLDAPWHYGPLCMGKPARTIDEIPLEWCFGNGVLLDCTDKRSCQAITQQDICTALMRISYTPEAGDIVLIRTGADRLWGTKEYFTDFPGMEAGAVEYLIDRGIKTMGIDAYSFDLPFREMIRRYNQTGDRRCLWPAHFLGRQKEYIHLERLGNLASLPRPTGFKVACFPIKITRAGAGWVRAVAICDEHIGNGEE